MLLPRFRPPQGHPPRPDPCVQNRPSDQPGSTRTSAASAGAPQAAQDLPHSSIPSVEAGKLGDSKGALAVASGRHAIDRKIEAGQLVQRTGEDGGALSAG